jgi:hypothetical protein
MKCADIYFDRVKSQEELADLIALVFKDEEQLTYNKFKAITENVCSDMFLSVIFVN